MTYNSCHDQFKWSIVTFTLNRLQDGRPLYVQSNGTKKRENGCKMLLRWHHADRHKTVCPVHMLRLPQHILLASSIFRNLGSSSRFDCPQTTLHWYRHFHRTQSHRNLSYSCELVSSSITEIAEKTTPRDNSRCLWCRRTTLDSWMQQKSPLNNAWGTWKETPCAGEG